MVVLLMTSLSSAAQNPQTTAISTFKQHPKVISLLARHTDKDYTVSFGEVEMGGICGFVGCSWKKLVSMVITAKRSNAPTMTILGVVEGQTPDRGNPPTLRFVELGDMDPGVWQRQL